MSLKDCDNTPGPLCHRIAGRTITDVDAADANNDESAMTGEPDKDARADTQDIVTRRLSPAARRAAEEARQRRENTAAPGPRAAEIGGRAGPDPVRYGDWETKGIASDF